MDRISVGDFLLLDQRSVVDVRNNYYYNLGHIDGALSVPYYNLLNNYSHYLLKKNRYYLYCDTGEQSLAIVRRLNSFGYDTVSIDGGYSEYIRVLGK